MTAVMNAMFGLKLSKINAQGFKPGYCHRGLEGREHGVPDPVAKRHAYAAEVTRSAHVKDPRIEAAFAAVPREDFVPVRRPGGSAPAACLA